MNKHAYATEQHLSQEFVLIVAEEKNSFVDSLKSYFNRHDVNVHISIKIHHPERYNYIFVIGSRSFINTYANVQVQTRLIFVSFVHSRKGLDRMKAVNATHHIIVIGNPDFASQKLEQIMWYVLEKKAQHSALILESILPHSSIKKTTHPPRFKGYKFQFGSISKKIRNALFFVTATFVLLGFFIPLLMATFFTYNALVSTQRYEFNKVRAFNKTSGFFLGIAEIMYLPVRPLYLLLSVAQVPEDLFFINKTSTQLTHSTEKIIDQSKQFAQLMFQRERDEELERQTRTLFNQIDVLLTEVEQSSVALYRKIPSFLIGTTHQKEIESQINQLKKAKRLFAYLPKLLGAEKSQKILLLFANNMELRPGGGFIGSFGILELAHFGVSNLQIYDVYDADGQLTAHIDPPHPIRTYLGQPHWFLRDSAFYPDFEKTYDQALVFLNKEIGAADWDGGVMITTTAVKDIIGAFGSIYLPDYKEHITKDNFYIKTQYHAENNFFPGSTQKKSFLSDLVKQIFVEMEHVNSVELAESVVRSLDQKFIVAQSEDENIQKTLDDLYWTGRIATPFCPPTLSENCFSDYQLVLDANLGVNKVNAFIDRAYKTATTIDDTGLAFTTLTLTYTNNALQNVYPGGSYVNYMQVYLPQDARVLYVARDRQRLEAYDTQTEKQKIIGFLLNLPPQQSTEVEIQYSSSLRFKKGSAVYQLVVQKQIGAFSNDLTFTLTLPPNIHLVNTNFSPLVKNSQIIYNTDLSTDRVFFIELSKE